MNIQKRLRVLFVCVHNSARSQMAEELLRKMCGETVDVKSAGLTPGVVNPLAVEVLREEGIDIAGKATNDVFEMVKRGDRYTHVITVCDETEGERCPIFPGVTTRLHWSFDDPSRFEGSLGERIDRTRVVREQIRAKLAEWCIENCAVKQRMEEEVAA